MATQIQLSAVPTCIHEQMCQTLYEQQRQRLQALCQWMTPSPAQARALSFSVFLENWRSAGPSWPAAERNQLIRSFAARFRHLFAAQHHALRPTAAPGPELVYSRPAAAAQPAGDPVRAAILTLEPAERLLYLLHEVEGIDAETLSAWTGLQAAQCARHIYRARTQLRRQLIP